MNRSNYIVQGWDESAAIYGRRRVDCFPAPTVWKNGCWWRLVAWSRDYLRNNIACRYEPFSGLGAD
jgi:hypothetical protein